MAFSIEQLSTTTWKIVENDRFKQYPFLYVILGSDKCILIDTGCGTSDYRSFVESKINTKKLPFLVICTHVHFDHVGGNHQFNTATKDICLGSHNQTFTNNYEINSLAMAHGGANVKEFRVTRWLNDGDLIYLDDNDQKKEQSLEVIFTPGHTPDSIALYAHWEKRLFIGDTLYPFTAVHLDCLGSNVDDFKNSIRKLIDFVSKIPQEEQVQTEEKNQEKPKEEPKVELTKRQKEQIDEFCNTLGLSKDALNFSAESLMQICDWQVDYAIDFYCSSMDSISSICPIPEKEVVPFKGPKNSKVMMSCGHVEANLGAESLGQVLQFVEFIETGAILPAYVDGEYGEFVNENFTLMIPIKHSKSRKL